MTELVAPMQGRRLDARFTLLEKLGAGGQGEVWRAHDDTRGIDIALKVPVAVEASLDSVLALFEREHAIASRLNHPSVLKVFPPHRSGDTVVLPMELATGGDLRRLRGAGYLDIIPVLLDIAQALEHAHERGVIHRDLKPGNVLFDARGRVKLADFGAAGTTSTTATDAQRQGLSPFTASPEQLRGEAPTEADDIYGLGALAYELLSGYPPYYPHFDIRRAQEEPVPKLVPTRQIPPLLGSLVMRMLAKDRRERPCSMREVIDELDAALNDTLAFDFESVGDPATDASSGAVVSRIPSPPQSAGPAAAGALPVKGPTAQAGRAGPVGREDQVDDEDEQEDEEEHAQSLGIIPELLRANALVARQSSRSAAQSTPSQTPTASRPTPVERPEVTQRSEVTQRPGARQALSGAEHATRPGDGPIQPEAPAQRASSEIPASSAHDLSPAHTQSPQSGAAPATPVPTNATQVLAPQPASTHEQGPRAPQTNRIAATATQARPAQPGPFSAQTRPGGPPQKAPAWANVSQMVPGQPGPLPGQFVQGRAPEPDPALANATQALPIQRAPLPGQFVQGGAPGPDPALANTTQARPIQRAPLFGQNVQGKGPAPSALRATALEQPAQPESTWAGAPPAPSFLRQGLDDSDVPSTNPASVNRSAASPTPQPNATPIFPDPTQRPPPAPDFQQSAPFGAAAALIDGVAGAAGSTPGGERPLWEAIQLETIPRVTRLEPMKSSRWPMVLLGLLAGTAVAVFWWLPRYAPQDRPLDLATLSQAAKNLGASLTSAPEDAANANDTAAANAANGDSADEAKLQKARESFDRRLAKLEARGAGVWGGPEFAMAKTRAAESVGAHDAGNTRIAQQRLEDASRLLDAVESKAAQALTAQIAAGQKALAAGQQEVANEAFDLARRIDPNDRRIAEGQRRTHSLVAVLPLIADGQNAESARNYSRAAQDYGQVLSLDPGNERARSGLLRANAALGSDNYAKAVGSGFAALGAGRLDDARAAFENARSIRPNGVEAAEGLRRVGAALSAKGFASLRQRAAALEAQERWDEAVQLYDSALQADPSLAFAQEGKNRAAARAELGAAMQALIDRPERLSSPSIREQARTLLEKANDQTTSGPVLRSQIANLEPLLSDYARSAHTDVSGRGDSAWRSDSTPSDSGARTDLNKPVRLSLLSDNATAVAIPNIGQFGTFAKREIELKPGKYTVIGKRDGYRDVYRDITVAPGQENQTISVSCSDPI